jgi:hypothetical protein
LGWLERNDVAFRPMVSVGQSHAWTPLTMS